MKNISLIIGAMTLCLLASPSFAAPDDSYSCDSVEKTQYGIPQAFLVVYKSPSDGQRLFLILDDGLPIPYLCSKSEGQIDQANYAYYECTNSIENTSVILSIDKDNLNDARLDVEKNDATYKMICELNPEIGPSN